MSDILVSDSTHIGQGDISACSPRAGVWLCSPQLGGTDARASCHGRLGRSRMLRLVSSLPSQASFCWRRKGVAGWPGVHGWMGGRIRQACPRLRLGHTGEPGRSARAAGPPSAAEGTSRQQPVLPSTASAPPRKAAASARTGFHTRLRRWLLPRNCDAKSSGVPPVLRRARCPRRAMIPTSAPSVGSGSVAAVGLCCL